MLFALSLISRCYFLVSAPERLSEKDRVLLGDDGVGTQRTDQAQSQSLIADPQLDVAHNRDGWYALHLASRSGSASLVRLLIHSGGASSRIRSSASAQTPLHVAAARGHAEVVSVLLDAGADIDAMDSDGVTPIAMAAASGHTAVVRTLLDRGANYTIQTRRLQETPLHLAAKNGCLGAAAELLRMPNKSQLKMEAVSGSAPLHVLPLGAVELAALLLDAGADPNACRRDGATPLSLAAARGDAALIKLLLSRGADPRGSSSASTPLHDACLSGSEEALALLLPHYANSPPGTDNEGRTALHCALAARRPDVLMVQTLFDTSNADVSAVDKWGNTPLHILLSSPTVDTSTASSSSTIPSPLAPLALILLEHGAKVDIPNNNGWTPLHIAVSRLCDSMKVCLAARKKKGKLRKPDGPQPISEIISDARDMVEQHYKRHPENMRRGKEFVEKVQQLRQDPNCKPLACSEEMKGQQSPSESKQQVNSPHHELGASAFVQERPQRASSSTRIRTSAAQFLARLGLSRQPPRGSSPYAALDDAVAIADALAATLSQEALRQLVFPPPPPPRATEIQDSVPTLTIEQIGDGLAHGRYRRVVVLSGAGISVSAGIPDFRSPLGVYTRHPSLRPLFEERGFLAHPDEFFAQATELFAPMMDSADAPHPTAMHYFVRLLETKGVLLRDYTQNVDGLEAKAGITDESVIASHGTLATTSCAACATPTPREQNAEVLAQMASGKSPKCPLCGGPLKPDIVFFGQPLPERFHEHRAADLAECDLLIIAGTSLTVRPFAELVHEVRTDVPRILINNDAVGPFKALSKKPRDVPAPSLSPFLTTQTGVLASLSSVVDSSHSGDTSTQQSLSAPFAHRGDTKNDDMTHDVTILSHGRDIALIGACDDGAVALAHAAGWESALDALIKSGNPETERANGCALETDTKQQVLDSSTSAAKESKENDFVSETTTVNDKLMSTSSDELKGKDCLPSCVGDRQLRERRREKESNGENRNEQHEQKKEK